MHCPVASSILTMPTLPVGLSVIIGRVLRGNKEIHKDKIIALRRFKDDVSEAKAGTECGIKLARFDDIKQDDVFEMYEIQKVARTLQ